MMSFLISNFSTSADQSSHFVTHEVTSVIGYEGKDDLVSGEYAAREHRAPHPIVAGYTNTNFMPLIDTIHIHFLARVPQTNR